MDSFMKESQERSNTIKGMHHKMRLRDLWAFAGQQAPLAWTAEARSPLQPLPLPSPQEPTLALAPRGALAAVLPLLRSLPPSLQMG